MWVGERAICEGVHVCLAYGLRYHLHLRGESRDGKLALGGMLISDLVSRPSERLTLVDEVLSYFESVFLPGAEEIT
jgi:hypothetical protein